jgi:hypothetical protein
MIKYSQEFFKKSFTADDMKSAYLSACKWYSTNVLSKAEFKNVNVVAIMPFLEEEDCDKIFLKKLQDNDDVTIELINFVSEECLSYLVDAYINGKFPNLNVDKLYPFLDGDDVKKLFYFELRKAKK